MKRIWKDVVTFDFHDEIDEVNSLHLNETQHKHCYEQTVCYIIFVICTHVITHDSCAL